MQTDALYPIHRWTMNPSVMLAQPRGWTSCSAVIGITDLAGGIAGIRAAREAGIGP